MDSLLRNKGHETPYCYTILFILLLFATLKTKKRRGMVGQLLCPTHAQDKPNLLPYCSEPELTSGPEPPTLAK